ncbi:MAG: hypothetical protein JW779_14480, partial [Candidatus Thorarchaeota archaeon]|nr:hypothetical protein [Candidatus Thorarchaeota archaeon]
MSRNPDDCFKYANSAKESERIPIPDTKSHIWFKEQKVSSSSDQKIISIPDRWVVGIKIGTSVPIFKQYDDKERYWIPKKETLEEGLSVAFMRYEGDIRCGVPFTQVLLRDDYGFGFAGKFLLRIQNEGKFYDTFSAVGSELKDYELANQYVRNLMISCLASEFADLDKREVSSSGLDMKIRNAINHSGRDNNLPSKLGLVVTNLVLESKKVA